MLVVSAYNVDCSYLSEHTRCFGALTGGRAYLYALYTFIFFFFILSGVCAAPIAPTAPVLSILVEREQVTVPENPSVSPSSSRAVQILVIFFIIASVFASILVLYCAFFAKSRGDRNSRHSRGNRGAGDTIIGSNGLDNGGNCIHGGRGNAGSAPNLPNAPGLHDPRSVQNTQFLQRNQGFQNVDPSIVDDAFDERLSDSSEDGTIIAIIPSIEREASSTYPLPEPEPELQVQITQNAEGSHQNQPEQTPIDKKSVSTVVIGPKAEGKGQSQGQSQGPH